MTLGCILLAAHTHSQLVISWLPRTPLQLLETVDDVPMSRVALGVADQVQGQVHGVQGRNMHGVKRVIISSDKASIPTRGRGVSSTAEAKDIRLILLRFGHVTVFVGMEDHHLILLCFR